MEKEISPLKDLRATLELRKLLKKIDPDIIHLHSSKISVIGRLAHFLTFSKAKLYYTPHGYAFLREDISFRKKKVYRHIEKYGQRFMGGKTIACGDTELEHAQNMGSACLVRNGINIDSVRKLKENIENEKLTIGILGRITFARNPDLFNNLALKHPKINFLWIGDGEMKDSLSAKNIQKTGWFVNKETAIKHLNKIDIYLQTSLWEGLPIALLEAMALEKPVLATNVIGNIDAVAHGETGFLFNNEIEFEHYLSKLQNPVLRKEMGKKGYERCKKLFNVEKNLTSMIDLYIDELQDNKLQKSKARKR